MVEFAFRSFDGVNLQIIHYSIFEMPIIMLLVVSKNVQALESGQHTFENAYLMDHCLL